MAFGVNSGISEINAFWWLRIGEIQLASWAAGTAPLRLSSLKTEDDASRSLRVVLSSVGAFCG